MGTITRNLAPRTTAAIALRQLMRSPRLPVHVRELQSLLQTEQEKRERFYEEMSEQQKIEFINGEVIVQTPARLRHTIASKNLFALLDAYVRKNELGFVGYEKMLITLTRNDYEPDVCYFGPEKAKAFTLDQMKFPAPDFVAEVLSPSTEAIDRGVKFEDYAAHGVTEYWIVDPRQEIVEQYVLEGEVYELLVKVKSGIIQSVAVDGFNIAARAIFAGAEQFAGRGVD